MDINFNKNEDHNKLLASKLRQKFAKIKLGGGVKRIEKQHAKGKMTARERIDYLLDTNKWWGGCKNRLCKGKTMHRCCQ